MSGLQLYFKYVSMTIRSQMEYKMSFVMSSVGHFMINVIEFFGIYALFMRFEHIQGWTLNEVAVFYGMINMSFAVAEAFGRGFDRFHIHVRQGTFDRILLRPRSLVLQIISSEFQMMRIGRFTQGFVVFAWGMSQLSRAISWIDGVLLFYSLIASITFFTALMIFQATLSFWSVESLEIMNSFTYGGVQMAQYPIDIYPNWFRKVFIFFIPIGSVSYFPIYAVVRGTGYVNGFMTPMIGLVFLGLSLVAFRIGTRYYCSTGS